MKLSPDPLADDGLTFLGAAQLHALRFHRSIVSSVFVLNASDRLVTDSAGGVLALTDLRRPKWRLAVLITVLIGGLSFVVWAGLQGLLPLVAAAVATLLVLLMVVAPRTVRSLQAARQHAVAGPAWLVTDVATQQGRHIGDRLVGRACKLADEANRMLVLSVDGNAATAVALYERHGFDRAGSDGHTLLMSRTPA